MKKNECIDNFSEWLKEVIEEDKFSNENLDNIVEDFNNGNVKILLKVTLLIIELIISQKIYLPIEEQKLLCEFLKAVGLSLAPHIELTEIMEKLLKRDTKPDYIEDAE